MPVRNTDPFDEDEAEFQKLHESPSCFIVFGKPGSGKSFLAKNLSFYWKAVLVSPITAIEWIITQENELGAEVKERLTHGQALSEELVLKVINKRMEALDIKHHGYVLDGLPALDSQFLSVEDQINLICNFDLQPDFIINVKIGDEDLFIRRKKQRVFPDDNTLHCPGEIKEPLKAMEQDEEEEDEEEEELDEEEEEEELDPNAIPEMVYDPLDLDMPDAMGPEMVKRPEDGDANIISDIDVYMSNVLPTLEDFIITHDRQKVIELNGLLDKKTLLNTLMNKMITYSAYSAVHPIPLYGDEEEQEGDLEPDELLKVLTKKDTIGSRFPWRKSRWEAHDPVALQQGHITVGKAQFAVSYLGKVYCMSSEYNLSKFLENPRPYLLPPQPRIPAKLCVIGPPSSGKSSLCSFLCEEYGATLLDMDILSADVKATEKQKHVDQVRDDAKVTFLNQIKEQIQTAAQMVMESRAKRAMLEAERKEREAWNEEEGQEEKEDGEGEEEKEEKEEKEESVEPVSPDEEDDVEKETELINKFGFTFDAEGQIILPEVTEDHALVEEQVEKVVAQAQTHEVDISAEMYCNVLEEAIRNVITAHQSTGNPEFGGWVLDNFPQNRDQWNMMTDRGDKLLTPDSFIVLNDPNPTSGDLLTRWTSQLDPPIQLTPSQINLAEKKKMKQADPKSNDVAAIDDEPSTEEDGKVPSIVQQRVFKRKAFDRERPQLEAIIKQTEVDLRTIDCTLPEDEIRSKTVAMLNNIFRYKAVDYFSYEEDEEEDDEEEEEEEGDEEVDKRPLGETRHYCPIMLAEKNVLCPGDQEIGCRYREKIYFFTSAENKAKFVESPEIFVPGDAIIQPPPIRICVLGTKASGKTRQGRALAKSLGLFHVSFHKFLEDIIIPKVKERTWQSDYEEVEEPSSEEVDDEDLTEEAREKKRAQEAAAKLKAKDLDDAIFTTPTGKDYLVKEFTDITVELFEKAIELRRALIAKSKHVTIEEAEETALSELEEAIHTSLTEGESLPSEILEEIVSKWWTEAPFKDTGLVLEGFPRTPQEANFMVDSSLYPDACVILELEEDNVCDRLVPDKMKKWREKMAKKHARRERKLDRRRKRKEKERKKRRQAKFEELVAEREARLEDRKREKEEAARFGEIDDSEDNESEDEPEIVLDEVEISDYDDEDDDDLFDDEEDETEEEAQDRVRGDIADRFDNDVNIIGQLQGTLEELNIPMILVEAFKKPKVVYYSMYQQLRSVIENRENLFAYCVPVRARQASEMLSKGYKQLSRFGKWDPVLLEKGSVIQPYQAPGRLTFPVIFRAHIYYLATLQNRIAFMERPMHYISRPSPPLAVPIRIAIVGPPKSGKSTLARRLERDHGIMCLSIGQAVRSYLAQFPESTLAKEIESHLRAGVVLPELLAVDALEMIMLNQTCQTRGYVLDGYPNTIEQVEMLLERSIIPIQILELTLGDKEMHWRGTADRHSEDRTYPLHDSSSVLDIRNSTYKRNIAVVKEYYTTQHRNWHVIDGSRSKWWLSNECYKLVNEQHSITQTYIERRSRGDAAGIYRLCVTPQECEDRLGEFGHYCPVSLATNYELLDCSHDQTMRYVAEFRARYYKMAGPKELKLFLEEPLKYVAPNCPHFLPEELPKYVNKLELKNYFPKELSFKGYCPVTYLKGYRRYEALKLGSPDFIAIYKDELYAMLDDGAFEMFMRQPWKYSGLPLPAKLPPAPKPTDVTKLPMLGYMEQTVARAIITAMTSCSDLKPKYPYINTFKSALIFIGLHLKAHNPKATHYSREKYRKKLEKFKEHCQLIPYLGSNMNKRYKPENERPFDFDYKMEEFLALKHYPLSIR